MKRDWLPDGRPDAAVRIAAHTNSVIAALNNDRTSDGERKQIFDAWSAFAKSHRVCGQIVDHMLDKRRLMISEANKSRPVLRNITGDREDAA